jgi:hypothetical protein
VRLRRWRAESDLDILVVALMWDNKAQIEAYVEKHELNVPVILADPSVASAWNIYGFPTYYVLDAQHRVLRRDLGYSTQLGLWWRSWVSVAPTHADGKADSDKRTPAQQREAVRSLFVRAITAWRRM